MEALVLAGGKAERLGEAAGGLPKPLARVGGRPLLGWTVGRLAAAGVRRVIIACEAGREPVFHEALGDEPIEIVTVPEAQPLGRGGGLRLAASCRLDEGPVFALNGDELLDVDLGALLAHHHAEAAAATITVVPLRSAFGVVELDGDRVTGFAEAPVLPHWVSCGLYVLADEALARLPVRGDHERTTFPELAAEGRLRAFRHEGTWLTVNTPKDLRAAEQYLADHPDWLATT